MVLSKPMRSRTWTQRFSCRHFRFDPYGDHLQTCQYQFPGLPTHKMDRLQTQLGHTVYWTPG